MRDPIIRIKVRNHWLLITRASIVTHFGKNPVRGGRPPRDRREIIRSEEETRGAWDKEENCLGDFFDIRFIINITDVIITI